MPSRAEAIADALHAALTVPPLASVPPARVFRDLEGALACEHLPALVIETGDEPPPTRPVIGHRQRRTALDVTVLAAGGYQAADAALVEAYGRLMADPTLSGLAFELEEGATRRQRHDGERHLVAVAKEFVAQYRTAENSLE